MSQLKILSFFILFTLALNQPCMAIGGLNPAQQQKARFALAATVFSGLMTNRDFFWKEVFPGIVIVAGLATICYRTPYEWTI